MTPEQLEAANRKHDIGYDCFRVAVWQRRPSEFYPGLGYARRKPGPFLALWRAFLGVLR